MADEMREREYETVRGMEKKYAKKVV